MVWFVAHNSFLGTSTKTDSLDATPRNPSLTSYSRFGCQPDEHGWFVTFRSKSQKTTLPEVQLHDFTPSHVPLCKNYSHSEIWVYRSGIRIRRLSSNLAKKQFRTMMSDKS